MKIQNVWCYFRGGGGGFEDLRNKDQQKLFLLKESRSILVNLITNQIYKETIWPN